jgi:hypothetical protein
LRRLRKMHLWVGLITSIIILFESVTGLILEEPQWFGGQAEMSLNQTNFNGGNIPSFNQGNSNSSQSSSNGTSTTQSTNGNVQSNGNNQTQNGFGGRMNRGQFNGNPNLRGARGGFRSLNNFVQQLHRGNINGVDVHWLMDLAALAMIFLSLSGIYMSIRILSAGRKRHSKRDLPTSS